MLFTLPGTPPINGYADTSLVVAGVTWTLRYEWLFYFSLPLIAALARRMPARRRAGVLLIASSALALLPEMESFGFESSRLLPFLLGMLVCELKEARVLGFLRGRRWAGFLVIGFCGAALLLPLRSFVPVQVALVFAAFVLVASGVDLWGLLVSRACRLVGEASYSIYLIHGLVLYCLLGPALQAVSPASVAPWVLLPGCSVAVVGMSMLTHRVIETPFIELNRRSKGRGRRPADQTAAA